MWQSYLKVEEKEHPLFCNKGIFNLKEREPVVWSMVITFTVFYLTHQEANNEGVGEGDQCHEGYLAAPDAG